MTKNALTAIFLILVTATIVLLALKKTPPPKTLLRCDAELTSRLNIKSEIANKAVLRTKVHFFFYRNGKGFIRLNGSVEYKGKMYILDRELWYSYGDTDSTVGKNSDDENDDDGIYTLRFTRDLKHIGDSLPYEIQQHFLQTEDPNISYHTTIKRVADNLYLISTLPSPAFICRRY